MSEVTCQECGRKFETKKKLDDHTCDGYLTHKDFTNPLTHSDLKCPNCNLIFKSFRRIDPCLVCLDCGMVFVGGDVRNKWKAERAKIAFIRE